MRLLGAVESESGDSIDVEISIDASPAVVYDAVVLPDGKDAVDRLAVLGQAMEFIKESYRHCKPLLALGASKALLDSAGAWTTLPSGDPDPGVLHFDDARKALTPFVAAIAKHRHYERETRPPRV